jgi:DNA invertase Pin-like site-specific DNA recombinase
MKNNTKTIKYFAYVRKSTEGEERQALSISSQIDKVKENFNNLEIVEIMEEKHSAFKPYNRPIFEEMIKRIQRGEASGIIAWHPDRLSRNEIDASTITYLVRTAIIDDLKFGSYNFDNSPEGIMMLQMSLSQSQYFSSKLGKDVRRGLEKKFEMGWHPNMCPNGYVNVRNNGLSTIEVDKERFRIIRKAFNLILTGNYSVPEVLEKLNSEWNFKPKIKIKNKSGKLSRSSLYRIFTNIFYAGIIEYNGLQKKGKHKAMISLEEYDRIQQLLGKNGKPRKRVYNFAYSGIIRCAECGCLVCADKKTKKLKNGKQAEYTYYRCTHKKASHKCLQPALEVKGLEKQIDKKLAGFEFQSEFKKLFFEIAEEMKKENPNDNENIIKNLNKRTEEIKLEKINLTKMTCRGLISDEEYIKQKNDYEMELLKLEQKIQEYKKQNNRIEKLIEDIKFADRARAKFIAGTNSVKKDILLRIGSNQRLKDKKLLIQANNWLIPIEKDIKPIEQKYLTLELNKKPINKAKNEALTSLCCEL